MDMEKTENDGDIQQPIRNVNNQQSGSGRKRGHQHHIRHSGTRTSNIKADEIIAALRRGDHLPISQTIHQFVERGTHSSDADRNLSDDHLTDSKLLLNDIDHCVDTTTDRNGNRNSSSYSNNHNNGNHRNVTLIDDFNKNNRLDSTSNNTNIVLSDSTNEQLNKINVISRGSDDMTDTAAVGTIEPIRILNSDIDMDLTVSKDDLNDSVSSGSSSGSKTKSKRTKKPNAVDSDSGAKKEKRSKKMKNLPLTKERPPLEGADADQWIESDGTVDVENDPEVAEWSKLRCTSERAEVVAEREYRRQNRRCADYPGLAFGRSIFSSDTMMKLNIIRNELHNIMKTQLKRVRVTCMPLSVQNANANALSRRCIAFWHFFQNQISFQMVYLFN